MTTRGTGRLRQLDLRRQAFRVSWSPSPAPAAEVTRGLNQAGFPRSCPGPADRPGLNQRPQHRHLASVFSSGKWAKLLPVCEGLMEVWAWGEHCTGRGFIACKVRDGSAKLSPRAQCCAGGGCASVSVNCALGGNRQGAGNWLPREC